MSSSPPVEFVVDATVHPEPTATVVDALGAQVESDHRVRSVWLDTHDWLLRRAGCVLEHRTVPGGPWLVLVEGDGRSTRQQAGRTVPTVDTLPDGAIADRVRDIVGIRALLPQVEATGPVTVVAVLDDLEKTVARVVLEGPSEVRDGEELPVRARVETMRGYEKSAKRAAKQLRSLDGVRRAVPRFEAICRAAEVDPLAHRNKPDLAFTPDLPAGEAFADTFAQLLAILRDNLDGTLAQTDTEFLHDFRVTVRRARAVLKFAEGVVDDDTRAQYAAELKWLGDQTSKSRDLDVYLLDWEDLAGRVSDPDSLAPFRQRLVRQHRSAHAALNKTLRSDRFAALLHGWQEDLAGHHTGPLADSPVIDVAVQRLDKSWKKVHKRGRAITDESPAESLHDLRKRGKELRYLLELFASLHDPKAHQRLVKELKRLQDNLGDFQDYEAQAHFVLEHADALGRTTTPATTLMSMGRLEQQLEEGQHAARAEFAARWRAFDTKQNQRLYDGLVAQ
ncbi:CHAD domain-containing protein [Nocardioides panacisoli]|uniref:CYTH and CHAD domain-containing protein n=1 Tax=Nocardioides panacisoli TaxID=627624 RepID=UPI001C62A830|nr:CHAD domain-containing protein [Nocardioides panacisoli]QYJ04267.1 CHAD domain-containing protein [Nocardioides panacisoli]